MKCQGSAGELVQALWDEAGKHTPLHPSNKDKKDRIIEFLAAAERLDTAIFFAMMDFLRGPGEQRFRKATIALWDIL